MSILFELGDGQASCFTVQRFEINTGRWIHYRYSKVFQCHYFVVGLTTFIWRIGPYIPGRFPRRSPASGSGDANGG
jgi:hypothetical protein